MRLMLAWQRRKQGNFWEFISFEEKKGYKRRHIDGS